MAPQAFRVAALPAAAIVLAWLPALLGRGAVRSAASLFPLADSANPYFVAAHAGILYVWAPLVVASACILFLSPGWFLSLALDTAKGAGEWLLHGFTLSLLVVSASAGVVQWLSGQPLRDGAFAATVVGCSLACLGFWLLRLARGRAGEWPLAGRFSGATLSYLVVPLLLLITLAPKFYWEDFNGDGAHAFESARLLLAQALPFWDPAAGTIATFPGITSMLFAFPSSWFIRLFGELEVSARLPVLLYLVALHGTLVALIEHGRGKLLGGAERWLIWLGLAVYTVVMAFSATYSPYSADIALPATQDTLLMVCFLGFILAFLRRQGKWMILLVGLTFLSSPNGVLLIGLWLLAAMWLGKPRPWREAMVAAGAVLASVVSAAIAPHILSALQLPTPGHEYAAGDLLKRFKLLQVADWRRVAFVAVPCGFLPVAALLAWRRQDAVARMLTLVTGAYFAFFYVQGHTALHYYVPVMLLPLVVYWRSDLFLSCPLNSRNNSAIPNTAPSRSRLGSSNCFRPWMLGSSAAATLAALVISLPEDATPHSSARLLGATIENRMGGYEALDAAAFRRAMLLERIIPYDWEPNVPAESYGGSPLVWNYYAHRTDIQPRVVNYVLQQAAEPAPPGMRLLAQKDGAALYVLNESVWASHRALRPPTPAGSSVYAIRRGVLFPGIPLTEGPPLIRVKDVLKRLGFDVEGMPERRVS